MSTSRLPENRGFVKVSALEKGPNGRNLCRNCRNEVQARRQTFCSDECVHEWKLRTNPVYQARHVLERDNGVCELCGTDCVILLQELKKLRQQERQELYGANCYDGPYLPTDKLVRFKARCDELELSQHLRALCRRLWEMDHRIPVVEGGGECGLENLRTLCWRCHRRVTAELRARRAKNKKGKHGTST